MPYKKFLLPKYPCTHDMWDLLAKETRPIVVYGMGNGADKLLDRFNKYGIKVSDFFASDEFVRGHSFHGMRVKSFSEIKEDYSDFIIVLSFASNRENVLNMLIDIDKNYDLYIPDMPVAGEDYFDKDFYNANYGSIIKAYESLDDEDSKNLFSAVLNYKLFGRAEYLFSSYSSQKDIYSHFKSSEYIIDAGAYNGDTASFMLQNFPGIKKIYAFEPDRRNFKKLFKCFHDNSMLEVFNMAVWSESTDGSLRGSGNRNSSIDSTSSYEKREETIALVRLDEVVHERVDFIKYDVEGAEMRALIGSHGIISKYHPALLVSAYHRSEDVFALILYIKEKYPEYKLLLRRTLCVPAWEICIIAV